MTLLAEDLNGHFAQAVALGAVQNVSYTGTAAASTAVGSNTRVIRIVATTDCYVATGANPTATTSSAYLPQGVVEYIRVEAGHKISAIRRSADGTLNVVEAA